MLRMTPRCLGIYVRINAKLDPTMACMNNHAGPNIISPNIISPNIISISFIIWCVLIWIWCVLILSISFIIWCVLIWIWCVLINMLMLMCTHQYVDVDVYTPICWCCFICMKLNLIKAMLNQIKAMIFMCVIIFICMNIMACMNNHVCYE